MRIDNSNDAVREYFGISLDAEPGTVAPIDLCKSCTVDLDAELGNDFYPVDRPSYSDDEYHCRVCGVLLDEYEDGENTDYIMDHIWSGG